MTSFEEWLKKNWPYLEDTDTYYWAMEKAYKAGFKQGWNQGIVSGRKLKEVE